MGKINATSRGIIRISSIFGGTQAAQMIGSVIRTKLIAIWIGEAGIGLFGLFSAAVEFIGSLTQLGLRSASVPTITQSSSGGLLTRTVSVVRRWGWILGLLGAVVMAALSPALSLSTFGTAGEFWPFLLLSAAVFLNSVSEAEKAVLQGLQRFSALARATFWGVTAGCLIAIPLVYFGRMQSVAPIILAYSAVTFVATRLLRAPLEKKDEKVTRRDTLQLGKQFLRLGMFMTLSSTLAWGAGYLILAYVNSRAGADAMGEYQAGYTLSMRYVSFVFAAFGMEYYPRLSAAAARGVRRVDVFMRHQMWLLMPVFTLAGIAMAIGAPWIVRLFYSGEFVLTVPMIILAAPCLVLRTMSWCMAFVILARGDGPAYLICESVSVAVGLLLSIAGYELCGIPGIGLSYTVWYAVYFIVVSVMIRRRYGIGAGGQLHTATLLATLLLCAVSAISFIFYLLATGSHTF